MARRELRFTEGTSNKFWNIELDGSSHTVQYGRVGTAGQTQKKDFADAAAAQKSYDKLVAEKLGKGYTDAPGGGTPAASAPAASAPAASAPAAAAPAAAPTTATPNPPLPPAPRTPRPPSPSVSKLKPLAKLPDIQVPPLTEGSIPFNRTCDLFEEDWFVASWRQRPPLPRNRQPFDKAACANKIHARYQGTRWRLSNDEADVILAHPYHPTEERLLYPHGHPARLTREEALFWAEVCLTYHHRRPPSRAALLAHLEAWDPAAPAVLDAQFPPGPTWEGSALRERLRRIQAALCATAEHRAAWDGNGCGPDQPTPVPEELVPILTALLTPADYLDLWLLGTGSAVISQNHPGVPYCSWPSSNFEPWFRWAIVPYLDEGEREGLRSLLRSHPPGEAHAALGLSTELAEVLATPPSRPSSQLNRSDQRRLRSMVFGLGSPSEVAAALSRQQLDLEGANCLRAWLALTEHAYLAPVQALLERSYDDLVKMRGSTYPEYWSVQPEDVNFQRLMRACEGVDGPEMAQLMFALDAREDGKFRSDAFLHWLEARPDSTLAGLLHLALGQSDLARRAVLWLRRFHLQGRTQRIREHMAGYSEPVRQVLERLLFEPYVAREGRSVSDWLNEAALHVESNSKLTKWVKLETLPEVTLAGHAMTDQQLQALLDALAASTPEDPHPFVTNLRLQADLRGSFDELVWRLVELWLADDGPPKLRWAMEAWGHLGTEAVAQRMFPLLQKWPGEKLHKRSLSGLASLQAMGTDGAIFLINSLATRLKFPGLKEAAGKAMDDIARARGLTRDELEDRIVPDCGLDERGRRVFDFGSRSFVFALKGDLSAAVRDEFSQIISLPAPGAKDDKVKAKAAVADFKLIEAQIKELAKIQPSRLEQAMIAGRRWSSEEFDPLFVRHPFMTLLAQRLVWGLYAEGGLKTSFRVTGEHDLADEHDAPLTLPPEARVGIVHPLDLGTEAAARWRSVLADYELMAPFPQLDRPLFRKEDARGAEEWLARFRSGTYHFSSLIRSLRARGWKSPDREFIESHERTLPKTQTLVRVRWTDGYHVSGEGYTTTQPAEVTFLREGKRLSLGQVDDLTLTETIFDLSLL